MPPALSPTCKSSSEATYVADISSVEQVVEVRQPAERIAAANRIGSVLAYLVGCSVRELPTMR